MWGNFCLRDSGKASQRRWPLSQVLFRAGSQCLTWFQTYSEHSVNIWFLCSWFSCYTGIGVVLEQSGQNKWKCKSHFLLWLPVRPHSGVCDIEVWSAEFEVGKYLINSLKMEVGLLRLSLAFSRFRFSPCFIMWHTALCGTTTWCTRESRVVNT